ncbi:MAG: glycosyltransferase family 2 protein [Acidimicrobiales bacterium]|nr:glycosyltransferase family 2 protein [Acidimicrobiales bacterium]
MPTVSIGVPLWNAEDYVEEALASLLGQSRRPDEIVVSDNASTDKSLDIVRGIAAAEPSIRVIRQPENLGAAANFNILATESDGDLFAWLAADDVWAEDLLAGYVRAHQTEDIAVAYGTSYYIDEEGARAGAPETAIWSDATNPVDRIADLLADPVRSHFHVCHPVFGLCRRSLLLDTGLIRGFGGSDKALIFELALRGRLTQVPEAFLRRRHPRSSVPANPDAVSRRNWFDRRARGAPMPVARLAAALLAATVRAPIPARDRLTVARRLIAWLMSDRRPRIMGGEVKSWVAQSIGGSR